MTHEDVERLLEMIDKAGVSSERRRHESSLNRRAHTALVIANAQAASNIPDKTAQALEAAAKLLSDPT